MNHCFCFRQDTLLDSLLSSQELSAFLKKMLQSFFSFPPTHVPPPIDLPPNTDVQPPRTTPLRCASLTTPTHFALVVNVLFFSLGCHTHWGHMSLSFGSCVGAMSWGCYQWGVSKASVSLSIKCLSLSIHSHPKQRLP